MIQILEILTPPYNKTIIFILLYYLSQIISKKFFNLIYFTLLI